MLNGDANAGAVTSQVAWTAYEEASSAVGYPAEEARVLKDARKRFAQQLGARADYVCFTSGGTSADAAALEHALSGAEGPVHVVTSVIEHAAVGETLSAWEAKGRVRVTRVGADALGRIVPEDVRAACTEGTRLVSVVLACNETGVIQPLADIARVAHEAGALVHTDAIQALGRTPIDVGVLDVDYLSVSAHKVGGIGGVGALISHFPLEVPFDNAPGAASFAAALDATLWNTHRESVSELRDQLESRLKDSLPDVHVIGEGADRLCNTSCMRFVGCEGDGLMMALDMGGIAVSTGSACSTGSIEPSPILLGMGMSPVEAKECIRFSFEPDVSQGDIDRIVDAVTELVGRMR